MILSINSLFQVTNKQKFYPNPLLRTSHVTHFILENFSNRLFEHFIKEAKIKNVAPYFERNLDNFGPLFFFNLNFKLINHFRIKKLKNNSAKEDSTQK